MSIPLDICIENARAHTLRLRSTLCRQNSWNLTIGNWHANEIFVYVASEYNAHERCRVSTGSHSRSLMVAAAAGCCCCNVHSIKVAQHTSWLSNKSEYLREQSVNNNNNNNECRCASTANRSIAQHRAAHLRPTYDGKMVFNHGTSFAIVFDFDRL